MLQTEKDTQPVAAANDNLEVESEQPIITDAYPTIMSDIDLTAAGFKRVPAWVRDANPKKAGGQKRHRARRQAVGEKQLNLFTLDDESCRNALKVLADAFIRHAVQPEVIITLVTESGSGDVHVDQFAQWLNRCRAILGRGGWRARALYLLLAQWQRD